MSAQLDLLSSATARRDDPVTAKQAGARAAGDHDRQSLCILRALVALRAPSTGELMPVVSGMPNRAAGCRLVGNSIVPWLAYAIFAAINRIEEGEA